MVDLLFEVESVEAERFSASPLLLFSVRIMNAAPELRVQNIMLTCQIRIEPTHRSYSGDERERLVELFGEPERWGQTLHSFLWTHSSVAVPGFDRQTRIRLPAPCTHDFDIASAKYFYGLVDGEAPLNFLFSGSIFYQDAAGALQIQQIPWSKEAAFRMPVAVWRTLMDIHYPDSDWLRLSRETFERLYRYKRRRGLLTWEDTLNDLLESTAKDEMAVKDAAQ